MEPEAEVLMTVRCAWCGFEGAHVIGIEDKWWRSTDLFEEIVRGKLKQDVVAYRCVDREACQKRRKG